MSAHGFLMFSEKGRQVWANLQMQWARWQWSAQRRADFYRLLAGFASDGLPIFEALREIDQAYRRHGNPLAMLTHTVLAAMRGAEGAVQSFGEALQDFVPVVERIAIKSGEDAGDLANGLLRAAEIAEIQAKMRSTIQGELTYPFVLILAFSALMGVLSTHVIPTLTEVVPVERWPLSAQYLARFADLTPWLLGGMFLLITLGTSAFLAWRSRWTGALRFWLDGFLFPFTLHRQVSAALLLSSLAALLRIGIPFSLALERLSDSSGTWERAHLARIRSRLRRGDPEGSALAIDLFSPEVRWQLVLYGRLGRFAEALQQFSARVLTQTEQNIRRLFAVVRTLFLVAIAGLILWVYGTFMSVTLAARFVS